MNACASIATHTFRVGDRTCIVTIAPPKSGEVVNMVVEWQPDAPCRLSSRELRQYRVGRNAAFAELADRMGERVMVVEV